jgi:23S rRNA (adenine2030-N6)-methyltransferase
MITTMLSYRHAFHAGNHADVLKHVVLVETLRHLLGKATPLWYVDTHAGVGEYRLDPKPPAGQAEWLNGIARLWDEPALPAALGPYMDLVRALNPDGKLRRYPGSPLLAAELLRAANRNLDKAWLYELQPSDFPLLQRNFSDRRNVRCTAADGFAALRGLLPPAPRRGLVFIDPSYELQSDYRRVVATLEDALRRFETGCYLVWYPIVQRAEALELPTRLLRIGLPAGPTRWLRAELRVRAPPAGGYGLYGSGMFVINPPWTLPAMLQDALPWLAGRLALDDRASQSLEFQLP